MKKILFYLPFIKVGGIERVSIEYLSGLIEKGYKVDLIIDFDMGKEGNTFEYAIPKEVSFQYIKSEKISSFIYYFRTLGKKNKIFNLFLYAFMIFFDFCYYHTKVKRVLNKEKYDYTMSAYQFLPSYLTGFKSAKHFIWLHGSVENFFTGILRLLIKSYGKKLDKYDGIITTAYEMKEQLESFYPQLPKNKINMIYNPFDFDMIIKKSNEYDNLIDSDKELINKNYICTVCRLDEHQKDITTLILAYNKLVLETGHRDLLYIIGDGPSEIDLKNLVKEYKLEDRIYFLGVKTNPDVWIKHADIFVLSSKFEGFGLVIVEAMIVETFAISSNCKTGPKEILQEGMCGNLFEIGNVDELANKLAYALDNNEYRNEKIKLASVRIEEFDRANIMIELNKVLS
jgi:glycosyltransferase involved in cell wall biosynthesis